jgi:hypothetical protein
VGALYEFGLGASAVGKAESAVDPTLSKHWLRFGDLCEQVRVLKQEAVSSQEIRFEEVAHDYRRVIVSAKQAMEARLTSLAEFQHAEKIATAKKVSSLFSSSPCVWPLADTPLLVAHKTGEEGQDRRYTQGWRRRG